MTIDKDAIQREIAEAAETRAATRGRRVATRQADNAARAVVRAAGKAARHSAREHTPASMMSEADLQKCILDLCGLLRLHTAHFRPSQIGGRWQTAVSGDAAGFPDLVIVGPGGLAFAELKSTKGRVTASQQAWLNQLRNAGQTAVVWTPAAWLDGTIPTLLRRLAQPHTSGPATTAPTPNEGGASPAGTPVAGPDPTTQEPTP